VSGLEGDGSTWRAQGAVARTRDEVLATAGSRYTYSANLLGYPAAVEAGAERIALVGMGCMASGPRGDASSQGRQDRAAALVDYWPVVLEDLRRRHLRRALREELRSASRRDCQDEYQGRLPNLDD
jgi:coenzyme F420-reducing hydrogenase beta subunit